MPELPEVETIKNQLAAYLPLSISHVSYSAVSASILRVKKFSPKGKTILSISRIGKYLKFSLLDGKTILSHLGMSGSWRVSKKKICEKHTHLQFKCRSNDGDLYLAYVDPRRFGNIYFYTDNDCSKKLSGLGVDVSTDKFTNEYILQSFEKNPDKMIKPFLLEQKYFAGIGNYMASEICAFAGIVPSRLVKEITGKEIAKIKKACGKVINKSVKHQGLSFHGGYVDITGSNGKALNNLVVFNQKVCGLCKGESIVKVTLQGRGTYYCPRCQK